MGKDSLCRGFSRHRYLPLYAGLLAIILAYAATTVAVFPAPNAVAACACKLVPVRTRPGPLPRAQFWPTSEWCNGLYRATDYSVVRYDHFVGIPGCGRAAIAEILAFLLGFCVAVWSPQLVFHRNPPRG